MPIRHADQTGRLTLEELKHLAASQLAAQPRASVGVNTVQLKNRLGQIDPDWDDTVHGWLPSLACSQRPTWHIAMPEAGAIHLISGAFTGSPFFRISLAVRSSRTSRSNSLIRSFSALFSPARLPLSRSACWHQTRRLSGEHPSFGVIARRAALSLAYSPRWSRKSRTPRSRSSARYRYLRIPGKPRLRLPDLPLDHPGFIAAYAEAMCAAPAIPRAVPGTIAAAIEALLRSERYLSLSASYRAIIKRGCDEIREQADGARMAHLTVERIQDDLAALSAHAARKRMKAWRLICGYVLEMKLITSDPSDSVRRPKAPKTLGHLTWTPDHIKAYRNRWKTGTVQRACMEMLYWTGARISDAVMIGPGHLGRDGVLTYRQIKTGGEAYIPWTCPLPDHAAHSLKDRDMMHEALRARATGHMTFVATTHGRTRSHKALGHLIARAAAEAGFDRSARGLRKARAIALAEGGASHHQIGAWTGHQSLAEIEHYIKEAQRKRAVMGTEQARNSVNLPGPAVKSGAEI